MTSTSSSRYVHSPSASSHTTESPPLSHHTTNDSETILVAKKFSNISLVEREERQQALDRLEILKTVSLKKKYIFFSQLNANIYIYIYNKGNGLSFHALYIYIFNFLMNLFIHFIESYK